jgi:hypothetical protein
MGILARYERVEDVLEDLGKKIKPLKKKDFFQGESLFIFLQGDTRDTKYGSLEP